MSDRLTQFRHWIKEQGLKATSQREDIAQVFFSADRHISVEELYGEVRRLNPRVGYATVYRTMKLLKECGLAEERHGWIPRTIIAVHQLTPVRHML